MKNVANLILLLIILTFSLTSCYKDVEFVRIESVDADFDGNVSVLTFEVRINNPNSFKINIVESNIDIFLNDKHLAVLKSEHDILLPANKESVIQLPIEINILDVIFNIPNIWSLLKSSQATFKFDGYVVGKFIFGKKKIKVSEERVLSL